MFKKLRNSYSLTGDEKRLKSSKNDLEYVYLSLESKLKDNFSEKYKSMLKFCFKLIKKTNQKTLTKSVIELILNECNSRTTYNTYRRHINVLINNARELGMKSNPMLGIRPKRAMAILHKPIENLQELLYEIQRFSQNLYLCCLLTYGCLLRPHREIVNLKWGDFSNDLKFIHLSGNRNKSGRNRIVPVPIYIREILQKSNKNINIFSGSSKSYNSGYFKTLWRRFKKANSSVEQGITIYSFRHSGAIEIFKRTGSLTKLQRAMGHSSLNVSLTYLRGLEVAELKEEDMPMV